MDRLVTYVGVIHGLPGPVSIVEQSVVRESWLDQGFEVQRECTDYRFDNGVHLRRVVEQDQFPSELACAECWISYEVIGHAPCCQVSPAGKSFDNACREAFWLKYHLA